MPQLLFTLFKLIVEMQRIYNWKYTKIYLYHEVIIYIIEVKKL